MLQNAVCRSSSLLVSRPDDQHALTNHCKITFSIEETSGEEWDCSHADASDSHSLVETLQNNKNKPCIGNLSLPISLDIAILSLRYNISRDTFLGEVSSPPKWCDTPHWYLVSHRHICVIPHFATYRAIIVRYPIKTSTRKFCDTIATSIVRYERYRCWASKFRTCLCA